jgi:hypothetical protein
MDNIEKHEEELHEYLLNKVKDLDNIIIYNNDHPSHLFTYNKKGVFAQDEGTLMNSKGIAVRSGQHCAKMIDEVIEVFHDDRVDCSVFFIGDVPYSFPILYDSISFVYRLDFISIEESVIEFSVIECILFERF